MNSFSYSNLNLKSFLKKKKAFLNVGNFSKLAKKEKKQFLDPLYLFLWCLHLPSSSFVTYGPSWVRILSVHLKLNLDEHSSFYFKWIWRTNWSHYFVKEKKESVLKCWKALLRKKNEMKIGLQGTSTIWKIELVYVVASISFVSDHCVIV